jgi:hypothetical protein|tara:strand:+ start:573 stop:884 length:312 start_codon:yes stop_codon:yes gene_type:complete
MKQLELNYKAYQKNSATSKAAWENKKNKITLRDEVYHLLIHEPLANHQIADILCHPLSSICARIRELQVLDLVEDSGYRNKSKYNKDCVLWQRKDQIKKNEYI